MSQIKEEFRGFPTQTYFNKGDVVICINDEFHPEALPFFDNLPIKGFTYRVRDSFVKRGEPVILLENLENNLVPMPDLYNPELYFSFEPCYSATRFELKTSKNETFDYIDCSVDIS